MYRTTGWTMAGSAAIFLGLVTEGGLLENPDGFAPLRILTAAPASGSDVWGACGGVAVAVLMAIWARRVVLDGAQRRSVGEDPRLRADALISVAVFLLVCFFATAYLLASKTVLAFLAAAAILGVLTGACAAMRR